MRGIRGLWGVIQRELVMAFIVSCCSRSLCAVGSDKPAG